MTAHPPQRADALAVASRLHQRAVAAGHADRPARAAALLHRALTVLDRAPRDDPALRARILVSLAHAEAEQGRWEGGMLRLAEARAAASRCPDLGPRALVHGQHGVLLLRRGWLTEAVAELDLAVGLLADQPRELATALLNRSTAHLHLRQLRCAADDVYRCIQAAAKAPESAVVAGMARHNRGYLALLAGDLPAALRDMAAARDELVPIDPGLEAIGALDRARALRAAGLLGEADAELAAAAAAFRAQRLPQDLAEVELERAEVALLDERPADARMWARSARQRLRRTGNQTWAALAELIALQAAHALGLSTPRVVADAVALADQLATAGLEEEARVARLVAARVSLAAGRRAEAGGLVRGTLRRRDQIGTRLLAWLARAELATDPTRRSAQLRAGLDELHRYQAGLGSLDLRTAGALRGRRLAEMGLEHALGSGRSSAVLAWSERCRALAARLPPVRPPADPVAADLVAELRAVRGALRDAARSGRPDPALQARRAELERLVRQRDWVAPGAGGSVWRPVRPDELRAALDGGLLVSYLVAGGRLHALWVSERQLRLVELGPLAPIAATLSRVRADVDALALVVVPERLREVVRASLADGVRRLDEMLWRPLREACPDLVETAAGRPVVIVPTGVLVAVPWTSLPGLRGRPATVAPSATWWVRARRARRDVPGHPLLVAGPGLARAEAEVRGAASAWPDAVVLTGERAFPGAVLGAASRSRLLHVAAHGVHEPDNPLFSALELAGGPLFGHELPGAALPPHVVLSACDLGLATVRPGDEALGMTAALLHGGVTSVVSGVGRLGDALACEVMIAHHRALRAGCAPAQALAVALAEAGADRAADGARTDPAPLVCFGAGW